MKKHLTNALAASLVAFGVGLAAPASAAVLPDFTVDEASVPTCTVGCGEIDADKINGAYSEVISFGGGASFLATAYGDFGQFLTNDGTTNVSSEINNQYALYALFQSDGTVSGGPAVFTFTGSTGNVHLWIDPNQDTTKTLGATAADPVGLANDSDDYEIAFATNLTSATGVLVSGVGGFFDLVFDDLTLTTDGDDYFVSPVPFYVRVNVDGDFDNFAVEGNQVVTGDVSLVALVPEPASLALLGVALLGLGFAGRRRKE